MVGYEVWTIDSKSEVKFDLRVCRGLWGHQNSLKMGSKQFKSDVRSDLRDYLEAVACLQGSPNGPYQRSPPPIAAAGLLGPDLVIWPTGPSRADPPLCSTSHQHPPHIMQGSFSIQSSVMLPKPEYPQIQKPVSRNGSTYCNTWNK